MLQMYNLTATVNFPARVQGRSSTLIDNIFLDTTKILTFSISPFWNGLSDHDAHLLILKNLKTQDLNSQTQEYYTYTTRDINDYSIKEFRTNLSLETWDCVFGLNNNPNIDTLFNSFLNNYLRIFNL